MRFRNEAVVNFRTKVAERVFKDTSAFVGSDRAAAKENGPDSAQVVSNYTRFARSLDAQIELPPQSVHVAVASGDCWALNSGSIARKKRGVAQNRDVRLPVYWKAARSSPPGGCVAL